jgi:hypothetical protein
VVPLHPYLFCDAHCSKDGMPLSIERTGLVR